MERLAKEEKYDYVSTKECALQKPSPPRTQLQDRLEFLDRHFHELDDIRAQLENVLARLIGPHPSDMHDSSEDIEPSCIYDEIGMYKQRNEQQVKDLSSVTQRLLETI